jgi:hypothetical protein
MVTHEGCEVDADVFRAQMFRVSEIVYKLRVTTLTYPFSSYTTKRACTTTAHCLEKNTLFRYLETSRHSGFGSHGHKYSAIVQRAPGTIKSNKPARRLHIDCTSTYDEVHPSQLAPHSGDTA